MEKRRRSLQRTCLLAATAFAGTVLHPSAAWSIVRGGGGGRGHYHHRRFPASRLYSSSSLSYNKESWWVVGDGDLSYAAWLVTQLDHNNVTLTASVWENMETHRQVYRDSVLHSQTIQQAGHDVKFGVDATRLEEYNNYTLDKGIDRIIFNFPHWRGKANIRYNRRLVDEFFASATNVLKRPHGKIHVALLRGQSGVDAESMTAWRQSWMVQQYANQYGLFLEDVQPFEVSYNLSSHRGVDRAFSPGQDPRRYVFGWEASPPAYQLACRHELRLRLDPERLTSDACPYTVDEMSRTDVIPHLVQSCVPPGVHVELPLRDVVNRKQSTTPLLIFLVVYAGVSQPLTRTLADAIRARVEEHVGQETGLEVAKAGRSVSKVFPYALLESLKQEYFVSNESAVTPLSL
eukprot:scaffold8628_cov149-Amphora_coffeaeformis.AAC.1